MFFNRIAFLAKVFWQLMRTNIQLLHGVWRIERIKRPIVSIFGGARMTAEDQYAQFAHILAQKLVESGISVMTGGGSGIMEAASCGARAIGKKGVVSLGIGVTELGEGRNPCVQEYIEFEHFASRKWLLTHFSIAFVVFPGGFGTLDELAEVLTLIQTNKLPRVPIVLIGQEYWHYFMHWLTDEAVKHGLVTKEHLALFSITDDVEEAFDLVYAACKNAESEGKS